MNRYYVKPIVEMNPIDSSVRWGVYDGQPKNTGIHCKETDPNLIVWTYSEITAEKIAELLMIDDFTWENMDFK